MEEQKKKLRILIVDDDQAVRESYYSSLETEDEMGDLAQFASSIFDESTNDIPEDEDFFSDGDSGTLVESDLDIGEYEIKDVSQGMDAVKMIESALSKNSPFSIVFLDVRMPPGIDGVQTARLIREIDPYIEIVIMTAYSDYSLKEIEKTVGTTDRLLYFHKPFKPDQIKQLATSLGQRWRLEKKRREQDA